MTELLHNRSFEYGLATGDEKHKVVVFNADGELEFRKVYNITNPEHWRVGFRHIPDEWDQPEADRIAASIEPIRVHHGTHAYHPRIFFRKMDIWLYQQVLIERRATVRLSAWAHAWSNAEGHEHTDNGLWSEGPGFGPGFCFNGQAPNTDWANFTFSLCIDLTGGLNPYADWVIWGQGAHIYNEYREVPPVVLSVDPGLLTVFLRAKTEYPFKHNDVYWDAASLVEIDVPEPPDPPEPPIDPRGQPRVQYERTYVLLPPTAGAEWVRAVIDGCWDRKRYTIGGSADDAGIGDLDTRRVIVINPARWPGGAGALRAFFAEHYPGVVYQELLATSPENLKAKMRGM